MFISIVIPTLNEEDYVGTLLSALVSQTFKDFEVIIVDGGSQDKTEEKVAQFKGSLNLQFVKSPQKGVSFQRNNGASLAKSEHLIFMDADDDFESDLLDKFTTFLTINQATDVATLDIKPKSNKLTYRIFYILYNELMVLSSIIGKGMATGAFIYIRKNVFLKIGGFDSKVLVVEDYDLTLRACRSGYKFRHIQSISYYYSTRRADKIGLAGLVLELAKNGTYYLFRNYLGSRSWVTYHKRMGGQYFKK